MGGKMIRKFFVKCEPSGQGRPRFVKATGAVYKSREDVAYEKGIMLAYKDAYPGYSPIQGAFGVLIKAYLPIPASFSKADKQAAIEEKIKATKKPDVDNLAKSVLDALNGIAYVDDKNCVVLIVMKQYGAIPGIEIVIEEAD